MAQFRGSQVGIAIVNNFSANKNQVATSQTWQQGCDKRLLQDLVLQVYNLYLCQL